MNPSRVWHALLRVFRFACGVVLFFVIMPGLVWLSLVHAITSLDLILYGGSWLYGPPIPQLVVGQLKANSPHPPQADNNVTELYATKRYNHSRRSTTHLRLLYAGPAPVELSHFSRHLDVETETIFRVGKGPLEELAPDGTTLEQWFYSGTGDWRRDTLGYWESGLQNLRTYWVFLPWTKEDWQRAD